MKPSIVEQDRDGYRITSDPAALDLDAVHTALSQQMYWSTGIPHHVVARAVENSLCFSLFDPQGRQVGLARVVSDYATFAWVADVYVLPEHRGRGLGKWLMACVRAHPDLQNLRSWLLATRDAHGLYRDYAGFSTVDPALLMWVRDPDVYSRLAAESSTNAGGGSR